MHTSVHIYDEFLHVNIKYKIFYSIISVIV